MDYVNVPVPSHLVTDVMEFIAARVRARGHDHSSDEEVETVEAPAAASDTWTDDELRKLWSDSEGRMRIVLTLLARKGGEPIPSGEIAGVLGKSARGHAVAGTMGALGRRLKHRHAGRWPFSSAWNALERRWEYTMPIAVASIVSKIAAPVAELVALDGKEAGFFCFIRDPAGRRCRITSVKDSEPEARAAAVRWLDEALMEAPPAGRGKAYEWVPDPAGYRDMHVCVQIGNAKPLLR